MRGSLLLSDRQWQAVAPLLPPPARTGRPRADDRRTLEAILYVLCNGQRWADLPRDYGSYATAWRRYQQWQRLGVWERIWRVLVAELSDEQRRLWTQSLLRGAFIPTPGTYRRRPP